MSIQEKIDEVVGRIPFVMDENGRDVLKSMAYFGAAFALQDLILDSSNWKEASDIEQKIRDMMQEYSDRQAVLLVIKPSPNPLL